MANHKSAAKRNRQRIVQTARNRAIRSRVRHSLRVARAALEAGDAAAAKAPVLEASRELARAASKGVLTKNTAARTISRVNAALAKLG